MFACLHLTLHVVTLRLDVSFLTHNANLNAKLAGTARRLMSMLAVGFRLFPGINIAGVTTVSFIFLHCLFRSI